MNVLLKTILPKTRIVLGKNIAKISSPSPILWKSSIRFKMSDETELAIAVNKDEALSAGTIFDKIINKQIPADVIYEDDLCLAFNDIQPMAPVHFLVIPKKRLAMVEQAGVEHIPILGHIMQVAGKLGKDKAPTGFRIVVNNGPDSCQSVYHLHLHVMGGRQMQWPPG